MDYIEVQEALRRMGIRVGPEMASYVQRRLAVGAVSDAALRSIPVIGGDARTGVPMRKEISVAQLRELAGHADGYFPFARGQR